MFRKIILISFLSIVFVIFGIYLYFRYSSAETNYSENIKNNENNVFVSTRLGLFIGSKLQYEKTEINVFLGIPYALPPVGSLRFRRPVPTSKSNDSFETNRWPNPCLQKDNHLRLNNYNFSEDCLYLNVWSPGVNTTEQKPVLLHIHTGAFLFGSASESTYNGIVLSALADVVVVTFNYRLNLYGFLQSDNELVNDNVGMYDQVLAIQWVSKQISNFGGDPNRITLFGQSTGAVSVGLHLLSPITRNLFNSAIMLSGSPFEHSWLSEPEIAEKFWLNFSKEVDCLKNNKSITSNVLECLTKLDRKRLPEMSDFKRYSIDPFVVSAPVVFDNGFRLKHSNLSYNVKNISILSGYTDDEGSWMLALEDTLKYGPKAIQNMTYFESIEELKRLITKIRVNTNREVNAESIAKYYFDIIPENLRNDSNLLSRTIGIALGDHYISCPVQLFNEYLLRNNQNNKVYQYYWTYKGYSKSSSFWKTFEDVWCGKWMGSCHSFELYSIFGIPFQQRIAFNDIDRLISMRMIKIVQNFVNNKKLSKIDWSAYSYVNHTYIDRPYHRIDYDLDSDEVIGINLKSFECNSMWKQHILDDQDF